MAAFGFLTHAVCQECGRLERLRLPYPTEACLDCGCSVFWLVRDAAEAKEASRTVIDARRGLASVSPLAGSYTGVVARA
jgi:hypothetical protein